MKSKIEINLIPEPDLVMSSHDKACPICKLIKELVHIRDIQRTDIYDGCVDCLIDKITTKRVMCICSHNVNNFGCKCGSMARERYLKK